MKLTRHAWILWGILLAVTVILALVLPFSRTAAYWIALVCTLAMYGVCAWTFARAFRKDETLESKVLGWPIFKVGVTALLLQMVIGFAVMALAGLCPFWCAALVEVLVYATVLFCLTVKDAAREAVAHVEAAVADDTKAWKAIRAKANALANTIGTPEMKKLAEQIRYADPMPTELDDRINALLDILSSYATADNMTKAMQLLEQRKTHAKDSK